MIRHPDRDVVGVEDGLDELEKRRPTVALVLPVDRDTDPGLGDDGKRAPSVPAKEVEQLSETVAGSLLALNDRLDAHRDTLAELVESVKAIGANVAEVLANTRTIISRHTELANEYMETKQDHVALLDRIKKVEARTSLLEAPPAPNGNGHAEE